MLVTTNLGCLYQTENVFFNQFFPNMISRCSQTWSLGSTSLIVTNLEFGVYQPYSHKPGVWGLPAL